MRMGRYDRGGGSRPRSPASVIEHGHVGYLREAYHGQPYATVVLVREAFLGNHRVRIPAAKLAQRLPATLVVAEQRERDIYGATDRAEIERVLTSYREFVALCARKEEETGKPCLSIASYCPRLPAAHAAGKPCFRSSEGAASFDFAVHAAEVPRPLYMPLFALLIRLQRHWIIEDPIIRTVYATLFSLWQRRPQVNPRRPDGQRTRCPQVLGCDLWPPSAALGRARRMT